MQDLEKKLNNLPQASLSKRADFRIRIRLYVLLWRQKIDSLFSVNAWRRWYPVPVVLLLLVAIAAVPGYAYTSPSVTSASLLYPLKNGLEQIAVDFSFSEVKKADIYAKLADRRLAEAEVLSRQIAADQKEAELVKTIEEAVRLSDQADRAADRIDNKEKKNATGAKFSVVHRHQVDTLANIAQTIGINAEEKAIDAVAVTLDGLKEKMSKSYKAAKTKKLNFNLPVNSDATTTPIKEGADNATSTVPDSTAGLATGTPAVKQEERKSKATKTQAVESLNEIRTKVEGLKNDLSSPDYDTEDLLKLFGRLEQKLEKARDRIESDDLNGAGGILQSTDALTNNAKH
ncbi:MAG: DUF5667 domain-containing protein, partial [Planctomycetes bacterium]|nr:DUF5667 domain-containing protein [Planctomycetota bacterium]